MEDHKDNSTPLLQETNNSTPPLQETNNPVLTHMGNDKMTLSPPPLAPAEYRSQQEQRDH
jgi:hypothetical protein